MNVAQSVAAASEAHEPFAFVQALALELSSGKVELPGFPDIVVRVQHVLSDENAGIERIVRVIGAEPVLAGQLLQLANSAALNLSGKTVTDLRTAVTRIGLNLVRSATVTYAVRQLQQAAMLKGLEKPLHVLWQRSTLVASLCYVLARRLTRINPDTALLAGLLHGIGRLYILTRASRHRGLFADVGSYQSIERDWHLGIAAALLENWQIPEEIVRAVRESEDFAREPRGPVCLTDILIAGTLIGLYQDQPQLLEARLQSVRPVARLEITLETCDTLLHESAEEIAALREALS